MNLKERIKVLKILYEYLSNDPGPLKAIKEKAFEKNKWFTEEFVNLSLKNISTQFLEPEKLDAWIHHYHIDDNIISKNIGIVMAGNIPLVGFHDFLCAFITGHHLQLKLSEKDEVLLTHFIEKMCEWDRGVEEVIKVSSMLKDCDAYIATGSNNSARYFNLYFGKYPSIIRNNKTSVAVLNGDETNEQLTLLADDVHLYFGLGCRNVTKIFVPKEYDFVPLLNAFKQYDFFAFHSKYKNNYDYNLALLIMNNKYYMTNESIILVENEDIFTPVSELHYSFYEDKNTLFDELDQQENIQCIVGEDHLPFGITQQPGLFDYADKIDTMQFLLTL
ncbi:MAG: acyl-CoA reductase [Bacteroidota bacterium]|nr:acyl-CoA reductase [Bacteroidota bacterium]